MSQPPRCIVCGISGDKLRVVGKKDGLDFVYLCENAEFCQARAAVDYIDLHYDVTAIEGES